MNHTPAARPALQQRIGTALCAPARALAQLCMAGLALLPVAHAAAPLKIGYSDWPGFVAWQIAIEKGWFAQAGVDAQFEWFDYSASIDAFTAGKIDAVGVANGDALVLGAGGARNVMILTTDYSSGNDMIIAKPGIHSVADLKGRKVVVEVGLVDHLMLLVALKRAGLGEGDVHLVNARTNEIPQVFGAADIDAAGVWQPIAGQAMRAVPGARPIFTSADEPGLIYNGIAVSPASLAARRDDWVRLIRVWDRVVTYVQDPATQSDAVRIMAARVGIAPANYLPLLRGTHLLSTAASRKVFAPADGLGSLYGSSHLADDFNVRNGVYRQAQNINAAIDPRPLNAAR
jgi:NitT/TauT family transport system substrate-binding protein